MERHQGTRGGLTTARHIALAIPYLGLISACAAEPPAGPASSATAAASRGAASAAEVSALVHTASVARGATALDITPIGDTTNAAGVERITRPDFVEILQPLPDGIEQSWSFGRAPGSAGDLTITVNLGGLEYVAADKAGIELQQPAAFDVHYGHGVWIDAKGNRTEIPAHFEHGGIVLTVPEAVVNASAFPAVLDPKMIVTPIVGG